VSGRISRLSIVRLGDILDSTPEPAQAATRGAAGESPV
jgi:hypothetical protein